MYHKQHLYHVHVSIGLDIPPLIGLMSAENKRDLISKTIFGIARKYPNVQYEHICFDNITRLR